jgi:16S rRNA (guanine527-N7)-methyltransferase
MSSQEFLNHLGRRASLAGVDVSFALAAQLESYYRLLAHWNSSINLTALRLEPVTDQAIDRLLVEPLAAARYIRTEAPIWFDFGSGGGSPAIPLKLAMPAARLTMVESKERKAAFLREVIRILHLDEVEVAALRIGAIAADPSSAGVADLITVRAVRVDPSLFGALLVMLKSGGRVLLFGARRQDLVLPKGLLFADEFARAAEVEARDAKAETLVLDRAPTRSRKRST